MRPGAQWRRGRRAGRDRAVGPRPAPRWTGGRPARDAGSRAGAGVVQLVEQHGHDVAAQGVEVLVQRGQRWAEVGRLRDVVEADDAHLSGTGTPRRGRACISPRAIWSLAEKTALKSRPVGDPDAESIAAVGGPVARTAAADGQQPCLGQLVAPAPLSSSAASGVDRPGQVEDRGVAEPDQVLGGHPGPGVLVDGDGAVRAARWIGSTARPTAPRSSRPRRSSSAPTVVGDHDDRLDCWPSRHSTAARTASAAGSNRLMTLTVYRAARPAVKARTVLDGPKSGEPGMIRPRLRDRRVTSARAAVLGR